MTILITGASRGIGLALFEQYQAQAAPVIGTTREEPRGPDWRQLDVTDPAQHAGLAANLDGQPIELLICNAGLYADKGHGLEEGFGADLWAETFATNVTGVFMTVQTLLPNLRAARRPRIAIISSQMASSERAPGGSYIYRASKAAALNLGRNLASDLRGDGIAVGIYHPGWVQTDMGGTAADLTPEFAAAGLAQRFETLDIARTGTFESFDGTTLPF